MLERFSDKQVYPYTTIAVYARNWFSSDLQQEKNGLYILEIDLYLIFISEKDIHIDNYSSSDLY